MNWQSTLRPRLAHSKSCVPSKPPKNLTLVPARESPLDVLKIAIVLSFLDPLHDQHLRNFTKDHLFLPTNVHNLLLDLRHGHHHIYRLRHVVLVQPLDVQAHSVHCASLVTTMMTHLHSEHFPCALDLPSVRLRCGSPPDLLTDSRHALLRRTLSNFHDALRDMRHRECRNLPPDSFLDAFKRHRLSPSMTCGTGKGGTSKMSSLICGTGTAAICPTPSSVIWHTGTPTIGPCVRFSRSCGIRCITSLLKQRRHRGLHNLLRARQQALARNGLHNTDDSLLDPSHKEIDDLLTDMFLEALQRYKRVVLLCCCVVVVGCCVLLVVVGCCWLLFVVGCCCWLLAVGCWMLAVVVLLCCCVVLLLCCCCVVVVLLCCCCCVLCVVCCCVLLLCVVVVACCCCVLLLCVVVVCCCCVLLCVVVCCWFVVALLLLCCCFVVALLLVCCWFVVDWLFVGCCFRDS